MSDTFSFEEAQEQKPASSKQQKPSKTFSWDEARGTSKGTKNETRPLPQTATKKPEEKTSLGGRAVGDVAGVGDFVAGLPGMVGGVIGATGTYAMGGTGMLLNKMGVPGHELEPSSHKELSRMASYAYEDTANKVIFTGMFGKLMDYFGYKDNYSEAAVNKVMNKATNLLDKGAEHVEKATGGVINKEDAQYLTNVLMLGAGAKAPKAISKLLKSVKEGKIEAAKADAATPSAEKPSLVDETLKKYEQQGKAIGKPIPPPVVGGGRMRPLGAEAGKADPKALVGIAAVGGGAAAGYALADQDKLEGAIAGGLGGAALMALPKFATAVKDSWSKALKPVAVTAGVSGGLAYADKDHPIEGALIGLAWGARGFLPKAKIPKIGDMTIDELTNLRNGNIAAENRNISNVANGIRTIVKDPARREAVSMAVESGSMKGLTPEEVRAANIYKGFTKAYGEAAKNAGVLNDFIENYVTHIVEKEGLPQSKVAEFMASLGIGEESKGAGTSASSQFAKHRKYATFDDLQKALEGSGLKIKTRDVADIAEIYGRSMNRAIENKSYVEALKAGKTEGADSKPFVMPVDKAPKDYVYVNSPQLRGQAVHPDMAPALKFTMEAKNPNEVVKGLLALSMAQKRLNTSLSFFHAMNLANAFLASSGFNTLHGKGAIDAALKAYKTGGLGDTTDLLLRSGLKVEEGRPIELDQKALTKMGQLSDLLINKTLGTNIKAGEKTLGLVDKLQSQVFDKITWDYMHTGMKLAVATREFERLSTKHKELSKEQVARQVASFVNDTFGGLDWYRVASEAESKLGRKMAMAALSPNGRVGMQIAMFAPDWTFSTFRALYKALPDTGGNKQPLTRELHRAYALRTAVLYMTLLNGINMQTSGHSIFDNKDPTKLEYKDGTTQQVAKHAMEGYEWLIKPRQTAINKLGPVVKEPMEQLEGKQYLSADGKSPAIGSRIGHALSSVLPIPAQQGGVPGRTPLQSATRAAQGMIGMPVYGMTKTEKAKSKEQRARDKRLKELRGEK